MDELKPCPFCGGKDFEVLGYPARVSCCGCSAFGPAKLTKKNAIEAWNRREPN